MSGSFHFVDDTNWIDSLSAGGGGFFNTTVHSFSISDFRVILEITFFGAESAEIAWLKNMNQTMYYSRRRIKRKQNLLVRMVQCCFARYKTTIENQHLIAIYSY